MSREEIMKECKERNCVAISKDDQEFEGRVRETMEQVRLSEQKKREILANVERRMEKKHAWGSRVRRFVCTAAVLLLAGGAISIPVRAVVQGSVKNHLEAVPEETIEEVQDMVQNCKEGPTGYSRNFSDTERKRKDSLKHEYMRNRFPQKMITMVEGAEDVLPDELCYVMDTRLYNLPEREMTDEELLEIIDFNATLIYALQETKWGRQYLADPEREQEELKMRLQELGGGISEEEALQIAKDKLRESIGDAVDDLSWQVKLRATSYLKNKLEYFVSPILENGRWIGTYCIEAEDGTIWTELINSDVVEQVKKQ